MHAISFFKHRQDAEAAALAGCNAVAERNSGPVITVDRGVTSQWWTVCVDEYIGEVAQKVIRAIKVFAAKIEIERPDDAHCGDVHGEWQDPKSYIEAE